MCGLGSRYKNNISVLGSVFRVRAVFSVIHINLGNLYVNKTEL